MSAGHTPWRMESFNLDFDGWASVYPEVGPIITYPTSDTVTEVVGCVFGETADERDQRAHLIAAAPELLEEAAALCAILDEYSGHDGETLVYDHEAIGEEIARRHESLTAAIAKARGA